MTVNNMSPFTSIDTTAVHPLGYRCESNGGIVHRYCMNAGADALVAGEIVGFSQTTPVYGEVSGTAADIIDGSSSCGLATGQARAALPTGTYGWVQTKGPNIVAVTTDGNVALGSSLTMGGTTSPDGTLIPMGAGTEEMVCAHALAADSSTTSAVNTIVFDFDKWW